MPAEIPTLNLGDQGPPPTDDFTLYRNVEQYSDWEKFLTSCDGPSHFLQKIKQMPAQGNRGSTESADSRHVYSIAETIRLTWTRAGEKKAAIGRSLICLCSRGRLVSITIRVLHPKGNPYGLTTPDQPLVSDTVDLSNAALVPTKKRNFFEAESKDSFGDFKQVASELHKCLFRGFPMPPKGVLVVAGQTKCGKSTIIRHLIWMIIASLQELHHKTCLVREDRNPHILSYEDPAEYPLISADLDPASDSCLNLDWELLSKSHIDFTQREIGRDTHGLHEVLEDALRQTPQLVYIGEVRKVDDWKVIFDFAGTGHFVVATTHASSLTETMSRMLKAVKAESPAAKGYFAQRIFAIVHLERIVVNIPFDDHASLSLECVLPATWRGRPKTIASLIADGLASVLPLADEDGDCHGRYYFAKLMFRSGMNYLTKVPLSASEARDLTADERLKIQKSFLQRSISYDLRGA